VELRANLPPPGPAGLNEVSGADLRDVLGELPEGVAVLDGSGRLLYANAEAVRIWGFDDPGEVPPSFRGFAPAFELRDADGAAVPVERWPATRALAGERLDGLEFQLVRRDGSIRWVRCAGGPVELEVGGGNGAWISFRDVGREEAILRELREERDLVTALVDMSPLAVAVVRAPELVVELANDVAKALRPEVDMVGTPVAQVFPEAQAAGFLDQLLQVAETGQTVSVEDAPLEWWEPDRPRSFSMTYSRLPQPSGQPTRVLIIARETTTEVTARARAEAIAAERSRDLSRARVTSARLRSLVDLAAAIASVEDLDTLLYLVTGEAARLLGSEMASLFLLDERGDTLIGRAHVGMDDEVVAGLRLVLAEWPEMAELLRTGRPAVHVRADQLRGPGQPHIERFGIRSYVAVRLGTAARPLGVLFVNHTRRHRFTRPELAFVETLTSYLSVTIERARLVSVLREAVTSLQAAVLPADFPALLGLEVAALYRSASEVAQVGGDFYDLFALEDGRVAAVIGDVCGKGVAAARHTVRIRYELRTLLEDGRPPGRVLTEFNRRVQEEFVSDEYATLLLVVLDSSTGVASWSSAGHPPPLLTGATPRTLAFGGSLPVGLFADATYQTARFTLAPGRCLVLYTDGVVEARNPDGQQFGTEGLEAAVPAVAASAAAVAEVVLKQVLSHSGSHLDDDAAVLVLRRLPERP
jgi:serine phosphatase RsbU (regulator of sigma subunit)/PAS domain-containing protein